MLYFFRKAFLVLVIYSGWVIFTSSPRRAIVVGIVWAALFALIFYLYKNRIVVVSPKPRKKVEKKEPESSPTTEEFTMEVDEEAFSAFTFNDYVVDTFKKQDANQILDLLADRNKLILEELEQ